MVLIPNIDPFRQRYNELEEQLSDPIIFKDAVLAAELSRDHGRVKGIIEAFEEIKVLEAQLEETEGLLSDEEFAEAAQEEIDSLQVKIKKLRENLLVAMLPPDPDAGRNTIIEIRAGAGGDEASLFAADLFRMYCKYSENMNWSLECLSQSLSESGGFKEVVFMIKGEDAWSKFKFESGVHRVQRVPVTEASGRIHTSTATVAVLPEAREVEIHIDQSDLEISVCRASGPGGQGVNTTDSAVQILHKPSGLTVYWRGRTVSTKEQKQGHDRPSFQTLQNQAGGRTRKYAQDRRNQVGTGDRSERIRTYNFPQSRITDHRINYTSHALNESLMGDLDHLFNALYEQDLKLRLENLSHDEEG